ncbi:MAG: hypothetical protein OXL41_15125 [Nitrospinae bacterium]|nr:hypothetical protein [Nitrospinota bacterium]
MRCVDYDPEKIKMPSQTDLLKQQLLEAENETERANLIESNSNVWAQIKPQLREIFHDKCWYTESPQQGTDVDVDHYRPKKRIAELCDRENPHPGYWWLAFSPENYRYSCIVANRRRRDLNTDVVGGKADHFPLWDESTRAWLPESDCSAEEPLLLDPCRAADVGFIVFKEDGEAMPRFGEDESKKAYSRADKSIEYYHLNHTDFVKSRIALRDKMKELIKVAKKAFQKLDSGDSFHVDIYEYAIANLRKMRRVDSLYSSFCISYLDRFKHENHLAGVFI